MCSLSYSLPLTLLASIFLLSLLPYTTADVPEGCMGAPPYGDWTCPNMCVNGYSCCSGVCYEVNEDYGELPERCEDTGSPLGDFTCWPPCARNRRCCEKKCYEPRSSLLAGCTIPRFGDFSCIPLCPSDRTCCGGRCLPTNPYANGPLIVGEEAEAAASAADTETVGSTPTPPEDQRFDLTPCTPLTQFGDFSCFPFCQKGFACCEGVCHDISKVDKDIANAGDLGLPEEVPVVTRSDAALPVHCRVSNQLTSVGDGSCKDRNGRDVCVAGEVCCNNVCHSEIGVSGYSKSDASFPECVTVSGAGSSLVNGHYVCKIVDDKYGCMQGFTIDCPTCSGNHTFLSYRGSNLNRYSLEMVEFSRGTQVYYVTKDENSPLSGSWVRSTTEAKFPNPTISRGENCDARKIYDRNSCEGGGHCWCLNFVGVTFSEVCRFKDRDGKCPANCRGM